MALCEDYPCCGHENASCSDPKGDLAPRYYERIARGYDYEEYNE